MFFKIGVLKSFTNFTGKPGADPAFLIRGVPNSEIFLSDLRELFQRVQFFIASKSS